MTLSREDFRSSCDRPQVQKVSVPGLGGDGHAYVKTMSGRELELSKKLEKELAGEYPDLAAAIAVVIYGVSDQSGKPVFNESDVGLVADLAFPALMSLGEHILQINGLARESQEELEKNYVSVRT